MLTSVRTRVVLLLSVLAVLGCSDRRANEERLLLDREARVDGEAPPAVRRRQIEDLEGLTLRDPELVGVRDTCVAGHRALLRAEEEQARASRMLAELTDGDRDAPIPAGRAAEVEQALEASNEAIGEARESLGRCKDEMTALRSRHG